MYDTALWWLQLAMIIAFIGIFVNIINGIFFKGKSIFFEILHYICFFSMLIVAMIGAGISMYVYFTYDKF